MTEAVVGGSVRVCGVDRGVDIQALEDGLVVLHSVFEARLGELKRWGIWRWRRRGNRTRRKSGDLEGGDKEQVDGAAGATGNGLCGCCLQWLSWRMNTES